MVLGEQRLARRRAALRAFYESRDPSKLPNVDTLLSGYRLEDIKQSLLVKYGELPEGWEAEDLVWEAAEAEETAAEERRAVQTPPAATVAAESSSGLPQAALAGAGAGGVAAAAGDAPPLSRERAGTSAAELQQRRDELVAFYTSREPSKLANVDLLLSHYRVEDIAESLRSKYGALPDGWAALLHAREGLVVLREAHDELAREALVPLKRASRAVRRRQLRGRR